MTVIWSEPLTRTPSEPNLLMLSLSRTMKLEPSIRMPTEPPASPEFASTCEIVVRSEEHTSELQSRLHLVCRLLLEKKKNPPLGSSEACLLNSNRAAPLHERPRR